MTIQHHGPCSRKSNFDTQYNCNEQVIPLHSIYGRVSNETKVRCYARILCYLVVRKSSPVAMTNMMIVKRVIPAQPY